MYRRDLVGSGYSPLTQIDTKNVAKLAQMWTYRLQPETPSAAPGGRGGAASLNSEATPIVVNGVMYLPAANRVVALEPATGKETWQHPIAGPATSRPRAAHCAGGGHPRP